MKINCPNCDEDFVVSVKPVDPRKRIRSSDSPLVPSAMRAVLGFMRHTGPGRYGNADLYKRYCEGDYVDLSQQAFVMALKANGATRWRTASGRGWDIPEIPAEQKPARVAPTTRERTMERGSRGGGAGTIDSTGMVVGSLEWVNLINAQRGVDPSPPPGYAADDRSKNLLARFAREARDRELAELEAQRENL